MELVLGRQAHEIATTHSKFVEDLGDYYEEVSQGRAKDPIGFGM